MTPKGKLSKRARRELDKRRRVTWGFSPLTRRKESAVVFRRQPKHRGDPETGGVLLWEPRPARPAA